MLYPHLFKHIEWRLKHNSWILFRIYVIELTTYHRLIQMTQNCYSLIWWHYWCFFRIMSNISMQYYTHEEMMSLNLKWWFRKPRPSVYCLQMNLGYYPPVEDNLNEGDWYRFVTGSQHFGFAEVLFEQFDIILFKLITY